MTVLPLSDSGGGGGGGGALEWEKNSFANSAHLSHTIPASLPLLVKGHMRFTALFKPVALAARFTIPLHVHPFTHRRRC